MNLLRNKRLFAPKTKNIKIKDCKNLAENWKKKQQNCERDLQSYLKFEKFLKKSQSNIDSNKFEKNIIDAYNLFENEKKFDTSSLKYSIKEIDKKRKLTKNSKYLLNYIIELSKIIQEKYLELIKIARTEKQKFKSKNLTQKENMHKQQFSTNSQETKYNSILNKIEVYHNDEHFNEFLKKFLDGKLFE